MHAYVGVCLGWVGFVAASFQLASMFCSFAICGCGAHTYMLLFVWSACGMHCTLPSARRYMPACCVLLVSVMRLLHA